MASQENRALESFNCQVFNGTSSFNLPDGSLAAFLFDTLDGRVLGWNGGAGTTAVNVSTVAGAVLTGLAIASSGGRELYLCGR